MQPIDLDVSISAVSLASWDNQSKEQQPFQTVLEAPVYNQSSVDASKVSVDFYNGLPPAGQLLGTTLVEEIPANGSVIAQLKWVNHVSPYQGNIFVQVRTSSGQIDSNPLNNLSSVPTPIFIAFAGGDINPYQFDPDSFNFHNPSFYWPDFWAYLKDSVPPLWKTVYGPIIYGVTASSGHCYGMSSTSILYRDIPLYKPVNKPTYQMSWEEARVDIQDRHASQILTIIARLGMDWFGLRPDLTKEIESPANAYHDIRERFSANNPKPAILSGKWRWKQTTSGHAVTAYKVVEIGPEKYIFIYDSNLEMPSSANADILHLDISNNRLVYLQGTDKYFWAAYISDPIIDSQVTNKDTLKKVEQAILEYLLNTKRLTAVFSWGDSLEAQSQQRNRIMADAPNSFLITDGEGRQIGVVEGTVINEIPEAQITDLGEGYYLDLPAALSYTLTVSGDETTSGNLSFAVPIKGSVETIDYLDFSIPAGSTASTVFGTNTSDWKIVIPEHPDILPTNKLTLALSFERYFPLLNK